MVRRAFTYIEVSVVIVLLLLAAAAITPSLSRMKTARTLSDFKSGLPGLVSRARETAITNGSAVDLQYDENTRQMQIVSPDSQASGSPITSTPTAVTQLNHASTAPLFTASLPTGVDAVNFQNPPETTTTASWSVRFYPDGTAAPAGIEFTLNDASYSLVVDANGGGTVVEGGIPDLTGSKWTAGDYVHRSQ